MNSINTIDPLENLKLCTMKMVGGKTDTHMGQCFIPFKQNGHGLCHTQKEDWLTIIHLPKKAPYLNPNERKVNQQKSQMYVRIDSMNIQNNKKLQYQNIWTKYSEDGMTTLDMTLDLAVHY